MWTLHPSNAKGLGSVFKVFLSHILNSLQAWTYQWSFASMNTERPQSTLGTLLMNMYSYKIGEWVCKSFGPNARFLFCVCEAENAMCICHWCSFNVSFCALGSCDWIMAFDMPSAQLSHFKATVLLSWMDTKLMWSLDWKRVLQRLNVQ